MTGPTPVVDGDEAWRATTPVTARPRTADIPALRATHVPDVWRPAAPAPRPVPVQPDPPRRRDVPDVPDIPDQRAPEDAPPVEGTEDGAGDAQDAGDGRDGVELEHGDRALFLALARQRLARGIPANTVHPMVPPPAGEEAGFAPEPAYANLVDDDVVGSFARAVEEAGAVCHVVEGEIPETLLDHIVAELGGWEAVVSAEPEAIALGHSLSGRGVEVRSAGPEAAAGATIGVTSAIAGVAATGSIVLDSRRAGGRLASLLPPVHVCVLPADRIVATPADVLRGLGDDPAALPPSLVLVTGPSRTGDIEQLLTIGAHGPTALHVIVVSPASD